MSRGGVSNSANSEYDSLCAPLLGTGVFVCCLIKRIQNVIQYVCFFTRNLSLFMLFDQANSECDSLCYSLCAALLGNGVFVCCLIQRIQNAIQYVCYFTRNLSLFRLFDQADSECDSLCAALLGI